MIELLDDENPFGLCFMAAFVGFIAGQWVHAFACWPCQQILEVGLREWLAK